MSEKTNKLGLPYLMAAQAQKHVTHNEALRLLDSLIHISVKSRVVVSPPQNVSEGDAYLIPDTGATGVFSTQEGNLASFNDGEWFFTTPNIGLTAFIEDEEAYLVNMAAGFQSIGSNSGGGSSGSISPNAEIRLAGLAINAPNDDNNRLTVASDSVLFNHAQSMGGDGDMRQIINKGDAQNTAAQLFQSNFDGHAEIGLLGNNDFRIKTSSDGTNWIDAIVVKNGIATFPNRPAFHVSPSANQPFVLGDNDIQFGVAYLNIGGHFDLQNGAFIAPLAGIYQFNVNLRFESVPTSAWVRVFFKRNGDDEQFQLGQMLKGNSRSTNYETYCISTALYLNTGDTLSVGARINSLGGYVELQSSWTGAFIG